MSNCHCACWLNVFFNEQIDMLCALLLFVELNRESPKVMNSYEKIMKRMEKRPAKNKFIPNR